MKQTRDTRRDQVVEAVLKLIAQHGMGGLTTASIAREVGISEANIYRHFQNKHEVLAETIKRIGEGLRSNVQIGLASASDPLDRLKTIFRLHLEFVSRNPGIPRLLFSDDVHANGSDMKPLLLEMISSYATSLEDIIREAIKNGGIRQSVDPKATVLTFIGMIQVSIIRWILSDFTFTIEDEGMALWNNFEACIKNPVKKKR